MSKTDGYELIGSPLESPKMLYILRDDYGAAGDREAIL
jgi:hypothetical protein